MKWEDLIYFLLALFEIKNIQTLVYMFFLINGLDHKIRHGYIILSAC